MTLVVDDCCNFGTAEVCKCHRQRIFRHCEYLMIHIPCSVLVQSSRGMLHLTFRGQLLPTINFDRGPIIGSFSMKQYSGRRNSGSKFPEAAWTTHPVSVYLHSVLCLFGQATFALDPTKDSIVAGNETGHCASSAHATSPVSSATEGVQNPPYQWAAGASKLIWR